MIKRLSASALVVLTVASCQQLSKEKSAEEAEAAAVAAAEKKEDYTPRVYRCK